MTRPELRWIAIAIALGAACKDDGHAGDDGTASGSSDGTSGNGPGPGSNTQGSNTQGSNTTASTSNDPTTAGEVTGDTAVDDTAVDDTASTDTGPIEPPVTDCPTGFDDPFTGGSLDDCWQIMGGPGSPTHLIDIAVPEGSVVLTAVNGQDGVWYQGSTKSLVSKLVTGTHWKLTATVNPRRRTNAGQTPTIALHVGGLMVRDPASAGGNTENYLFTMAGSSEFASPTIEVKSTDDGVSTFTEPDWSNPQAAELRICRLGHAFHLYKRVPGQGTWQLGDANNAAAPVMRPDLPETLQVGLALNFAGPQNDLAVAFTDVTLAAEPPTSEADCTAD